MYLIFSDGPGLEIRLDVSRVKVRDAHQKPGPRVCPKLPKAEPRLWKDHHSYLLSYMVNSKECCVKKTGLVYKLNINKKVNPPLLKFQLFTRETSSLVIFMVKDKKDR